ncbi:MAG: hypothetical protein Q9202_001229 [Teloschistes flavicans]
MDIARQKSYTLIPHAGLKRPLEQVSVAETQVDWDDLGPANPSARHVLAVPLSGQRPTSTGLNRITASKIRDADSEATDFDGNATPARPFDITSIPSSSLNPLLTLSHPRYGLPESLVKNFASMGIKTIYPWQSSCLLGRGLLSGEKNLVYTAPTGGGKSLVADVLMLKKVLGSPNAKAILVLPYVALVQEKITWLRKVVEGVNKDLLISSSVAGNKYSRLRKDRSIRVVGFFGGSKTRAAWGDVDIAVCTFEKANMLVNTAIEQCTISDLGVVILDELHMIDDDHRGYLMELLATKLLSLERSVQIVGMSATLPNTQLLAKWLDAKYYESKYKPVPIKEFLVYDNSIYPLSTPSAVFRAASQCHGPWPSQLMIPSGTIEASTYKELHSPSKNSVVALAVDAASRGYGALVFCSSRDTCQTNAHLISRAMPEYDSKTLAARQDIIHDLSILAVGLDESLGITIPKGVAFHRTCLSMPTRIILSFSPMTDAGLAAEEREILARAYDNRIILVIVATCSLAAGINLPARRVIIDGTRMGRDAIAPAML